MFSLMTPIQAQMDVHKLYQNQLHISPNNSIVLKKQYKTIFRENPMNRPIIYAIDFLRIDYATLISLEQLQESDIKRIHLNKKEPNINIITKLLVVYNSELLSSKREKKTILSTVDYKDIESIIRIDREKSVELYGKKGKNGALVIKCKT